MHELEAIDWVRRTDHEMFPAGGGWSPRCKCGWIGRVETTPALAELVGRRHLSEPAPIGRRAVRTPAA